MTTIARKGRYSAALVALLVAAALSACGSDSGGEQDPASAASAPDFEAMIEAAPPKLQQLYRGEGAGGVVGGGAEALERRIAGLRGIPIVLNKWASWCQPCREEVPELQAQAAARGNEVAFIGINSLDNDDAAKTYLRDHPLPYPSYSDPDEQIAASFGANNLPETIFLDRDGDIAHVKTGPYTDAAELGADIERFFFSED